MLPLWISVPCKPDQTFFSLLNFWPARLYVQTVYVCVCVWMGGGSVPTKGVYFSILQPLKCLNLLPVHYQWTWMPTKGSAYNGRRVPISVDCSPIFIQPSHSTISTHENHCWLFHTFRSSAVTGERSRPDTTSSTAPMSWTFNVEKIKMAAVSE